MPSTATQNPHFNHIKHALHADYDRIAGTHALGYGEPFVEVAGPYASLAEARSAQKIMFPDGTHPESGQHIDLVYHPTRRQLREFRRTDRMHAAYWVSYWQVCETRRLPNGHRLLGVPLSPMFKSLQACRKAYAEIKGRHPGAYKGQCRALFNWRSPEDIQSRKDLLSLIARGEL